MSRIIRPIATRLRHDLRHALLLDRVRMLHQIHIQPAADVPGDVAVEGPHARVVRVVLHHEVAVRLDHLHVPPVREGVVGDGAVPGAGALGEDEEVVAVQVHGVQRTDFVVDDQPDGGVVVEIVHVPLLSSRGSR